MNKKAVISNVLISLVVNLIFGGLLIGAGVLVLKYPNIFGIVLNCAFALIGISLVLTTIPNLVLGIANFKEKKAKFDLIFSIVTIAIGVVLGLYGIISLLMVIGVDMLHMPAFVVLGMAILRYLLCGLIALYLIVLPIIRIIKAQSKWNQFKLELVKLILGVLIVVLLICGLLANFINQFIGIVLIVIGVLSVLLAILNLIVGLIGLKKADKVQATAIDVDGDGKADAVAIDVDGDGKVDAIAVDVDGDGEADAIVIPVEKEAAPAEETKEESAE